MNDRPNDLIKIRPILNLKKSSQISDEESFQNDTLRPIIKLQSPLLIETYKNYIDKHKNVFYDLSNEKKLDYIENSLNKNQKFRNLLKGMITGLFTVEEYLGIIVTGVELSIVSGLSLAQVKTNSNERYKCKFFTN